MSGLYQMKITYEVLGGHTHIHIWTGRPGCVLGKAGDLCMTNEEFTAWKDNQIQLDFVEVNK